MGLVLGFLATSHILRGKKKTEKERKNDEGSSSMDGK
jgi:hypothetical protein